MLESAGGDTAQLLLAPIADMSLLELVETGVERIQKFLPDLNLEERDAKA